MASATGAREFGSRVASAAAAMAATMDPWREVWRARFLRSAAARFASFSARQAAFSSSDHWSKGRERSPRDAGARGGGTGASVARVAGGSRGDDARAARRSALAEVNPEVARVATSAGESGTPRGPTSGEAEGHASSVSSRNRAAVVNTPPLAGRDADAPVGRIGGAPAKKPGGRRSDGKRRSAKGTAKDQGCQPPRARETTHRSGPADPARA